MEVIKTIAGINKLINIFKYLQTPAVTRVLQRGLKKPKLTIIYSLPTKPTRKKVALTFDSLFAASLFDKVVTQRKWKWESLVGGMKTNPHVNPEYDIWYMHKAKRVGRRRVRAINDAEAVAKVKKIVGDNFVRLLNISGIHDYDKINKQYFPEKYPNLKSNPVTQANIGTIIYDRILALEAIKGGDSLWPKEKFRHDFKSSSKAVVYGLPDGSILIKSKSNKKLWKVFNY